MLGKIKLWNKDKTHLDDSRILSGKKIHTFNNWSSVQPYDKKFVEAASYFERAAMAYQKFDKKADELDCKAKSYISRAAAEKNISGRKLYLKKAVELIEERGSDEPVIKAHLSYYNALFVEEERPDLALKYYTEALQNYQLAGIQSRIEEIKSKIQKLIELV